MAGYQLRDVHVRIVQRKWPGDRVCYNKYLFNVWRYSAVFWSFYPDYVNTALKLNIQEIRGSKTEKYKRKL